MFLLFCHLIRVLCKLLPHPGKPSANSDTPLSLQRPLHSNQASENPSEHPVDPLVSVGKAEKETAWALLDSRKLVMLDTSQKERI